MTKLGKTAVEVKHLWLGNFLNLKLNKRLPTKKIRKLDIDSSMEEEKIFKLQIHSIVISRDCSGQIGSNITYVHLLPQEKFELKIQAYNTKIV